MKAKLLRRTSAAAEPLELRTLLSKTVYVDANAAITTHNGTAWGTAYADLQQALTAATSGDQILVADGTYKPTSGTSRTVTFQLKSGVAMYGGYAGYGAANPDARDVNSFPSILSGDIGVAGKATDNTYNVVTASGTTAATILDGFTIRDGNANGVASPTTAGAGLYESSGSPTIRNCTFTANAASNGGGICSLSSSPTISNCTFTGNTATVLGGAIESDSTNGSITDCTFNGNSESSSTSSGGGAIANSASSPTISACTFLSNTSTAFAGAICNINQSAPTISNCSFTTNTASKGGGAIENSGSNPSIIACTFTSDAGGTYGGAIYSDGSSPSVAATISQCTFTTNTAGLGGAMYDLNYSAPNVANCTFTANSAGSGGAVYEDSQSEFTNCTFARNSASNYGGCFYFQISNCQVTNCLLTNNTSQYVGGAIYFDTRGGTVSATVANSTIAGNYAAVSGAGVYAEDEGGQRLHVVNCIIWDNISPSGPGVHNADIASGGGTVLPADVTYSDVQGGYSGTGNSNIDPLFARNPSAGADGIWGTVDDDLGDVHISPASPVVDAGNNSAVPSGITTDFGGSPRFQQVPTAPVAGSGTEPIVDMGAYEAAAALTSNPGGPYIVVAGKTLVLVGHGASAVPGTLKYEWEWSGNQLFDEATGANPSFPVNSFAVGSTVNVSLRVTDAANQAIVSTTTVQIVPQVLYVDSRATGANNGTNWSNAFSSLTSALSQAVPGQTIEVATGTYRPTSANDRTASFVIPNEVQVLGGYAGLNSANHDSRDPTLYPTTLSGDIGTPGNSADNSNHIVTTSGTDTNTILDGLIITAAASSSLYNVAGSVTVRNCTFVANTGAVYNYFFGSPTFSGCTFSNNSSTDGGAVYGYLAPITLSNCTFINNFASDSGGAIYDDTGTATLNNCTFTANSATNDGGAIYEFATAQLTACIFEGNKAILGGGIYVLDSDPTFVNCMFVGNTATTNGGAIVARDQSRLTIDDSTFAANVAATAGGAIYTYNSNVDNVNNSILWGNTAPTNSQISFGGGILNVNYCDVQGGYGGFHVSSTDPLFNRNPSPGADGLWNGVNDDYGNLHLQSTSPAIDAGSNTYVPNGLMTDLNGNTRIVDIVGAHDPGAIVDMGAYEAQPSLSIVTGKFSFDTQPRIAVTFNNAVDPSTISTNDLSILNDLNQVVPNTPTAVSIDANGVTVYWNTSLTNGNYEAILAAGSVADFTGNSNASTYTLPFFILTADANHDRTVNALDFNILATNYGKPGTFSQGDFDYSGTVDSSDFDLLASRFGMVLAPPSGSAMPADQAQSVSFTSLSAPQSSLFSNRPIRMQNVLLDDGQVGVVN